MRRRRSTNGVADDVGGEARIPAPAQTVAVKRALASQIEHAMTENRLTKAEMARRCQIELHGASSATISTRTCSRKRYRGCAVWR
jgi:hypothetical protein